MTDAKVTLRSYGWIDAAKHKGVIHMPLTFTVNGQQVTAEQFEAMAQKKKPRAPKDPVGYHKGWRVVGHAPGAVEDAYHAHDRAIQEYRNASPKRRAEMVLKEPKPWDEDFWRRNSKKTALRSKPYEIYEAAELCADMARQDGWEDVEIIEVKKEVRNDSFMA